MYCRQGKERAFFIGGREKGRGNDTLATRAEMAARACHRRRSNAEFFASSWRERDRDMGRERERDKREKDLLDLKGQFL